MISNPCMAIEATISLHLPQVEPTFMTIMETISYARAHEVVVPTLLIIEAHLVDSALKPLRYTHPP